MPVDFQMIAPHGAAIPVLLAADVGFIGADGEFAEVGRAARHVVFQEQTGDTRLPHESVAGP
ncbi:MAG: hypothetical protein IJJ26_05865, partial [Victivallales bacterium]|nr:hypothetical protein [Victivallales bacterium]